MRSPVRWAGSKRQMLNLLRSYWDNDATYIEPFAGSACLFFDLEPNRAIIGDLNGELINSYRSLRDDPESTLAELRPLRPSKERYYEARAQSPQNLAGAEAAARFFFLNRHCFNGLYRTNLKGEFNVPFGLTKGAPPLDEALLLSASKLLSRAQLVNADFEVTLDKAHQGDFVYLDPPYISRRDKVFSEYLPNSFKDRDLSRLRDCLEELDKRGVVFVITYSECAEARKLMAKWKPKRWKARRHIAGFAAHRRFSFELIATNKASKNGH
jgi:DNA adenine methylase